MGRACLLAWRGRSLAAAVTATFVDERAASFTPAWVHSRDEGLDRIDTICEEQFATTLSYFRPRQLGSLLLALLLANVYYNHVSARLACITVEAGL